MDELTTAPAGEPVYRRPQDLDYIRVSSLKTFEQCPYTWAMRYLPLGGEADGERTSRAAEVGTAVHVLCESFLMQMHSPGYEKDQAALDAAMSLVPVDEVDNVMAYLQALLALPVANALCVEERLFYRMNDEAPPISGQMDFVYEAADGALVVHDHKTNRSYNNKEWWSTQLQQLLYMWMARKEWPGFPKYRFTIGYPNLGTMVEWETSLSDDVALEARLAGIWSAMVKYDAAGDWPQSINEHCGFCPVRQDCRAHHDAVHAFSESFNRVAKDSDTLIQLEYVTNVKKIVEALHKELSDRAKAEVKAAGGSVESDGKVWYLDSTSRREAPVMATVSMLNELVGVSQEAKAAVEGLADELLTVKVGGLDKLAKALPSESRRVLGVARKVVSEAKSLKSREA